MRIAADLIDPDADKVVRRLSRHGYQAYLVGGCVRDLLLGRTPKDFDVATSATPSEITDLFRNCRIIGRRFRLAHIFFGPNIIETSTFRANPRENAHADEELLIRRDNVFGSDTEDAQRRDFTINGLFYDVEEQRVIDHVGGMEDLRAGLVRTIGDPDIRFREDPVRMMRAIKFAARLGFDIEHKTYNALVRHRTEINKCPQPRVLEELYRLLRGGAAQRSIEQIVETGIAATLSPRLSALFTGHRARPRPLVDDREASPEVTGNREDWASTWDAPGAPEAATSPQPQSQEQARSSPASLDLSFMKSGDEFGTRQELAWNMLGQLDRLVAEGRETSNPLALSAMLAPFVLPELLAPGTRPMEANEIIGELFAPMATQLRLARRDTERLRQILLAQRRLVPSRRRRGKPMALIRRDYFEEALTAYELMASASELESDAEYWRQLQSEDQRENGDRTGKKRRRRRGGRRRRRTPGETANEAS